MNYCLDFAKNMCHTDAFIEFSNVKQVRHRILRNSCFFVLLTLPPSGPLSYLHGSELKTWTSYWKREGSAGMDMWNAPTVQSRQPLTYRLMESVGLGGPRWLGNSWQRGIAESGSSQLSTLMIETPGDLVWDLPCVQQASCLEGGPLLWIWPLYLHVNQKSDDDDDDDFAGVKKIKKISKVIYFKVYQWDQHSAFKCCP